MLQVLRYMLWGLARVVLALRYRLRVHGKEQLRGLRGPVLILPNHPGYIDPALVLTALWPTLHPRPMLFVGMFQIPVLYPLMRLLNAVQMPGLDRPSAQARAQAEQSIAEVINGLHKGENHILWPSGHVQRNGREQLGGARALSDILRAVPEAQVVLVRTRGVWGSRFSYARTGSRPSLGKGLLAGLGYLLANLLVLMPRRRVDITVEHLDRHQLPELRRETLNPWLEEWYNAAGPEAPTYVPYHFLFGPRTYEFPKPAGLAAADLSQVAPTTRKAVAEILEDRLGRPLTDAEQKPETTLAQLGLDSLDLVELTLAVEQRFGFTGDQAPVSLDQLWALAQGLVEKAPPKPAPPEWFRPPSDQGLLEIKGETIPEALVARALANPQDVAAADDLAGVLTYERLLIGALIMARRFDALPAANVGLMLPASVACDIALLGLHLARKVPVVLNWTTGPANLAHAARTMGLTHVVTSRRFIDRLGITVEGVENYYLEDVRTGVGRWEKLWTFLTVRFRPGRVRGRVPKGSPDQPAVVLFTSGSERAPKAVPLTHANIISDARAGIPFLKLTRAMSMLGMLPAFHSFGLSVTGVMPLMGGMRVVHHPDPTDAGGLARKIAAYRPTMLVATPTFVSYILDRAEPGQLTSLRLVVVGAEPCPPSLRDRCAQAAPEAHILEGYGITECAPVVSVNRPEANRPGTVGQPLPAVETCVIDPENGAALPRNRMGELWVSGPMVFPGYLGYDGPSPFRERDGKRWYATGDLVVVDAEGFIHFRGRSKRFLKAGGEMISLPALEEPFTRMYPPTEDDGPRVAVEGVETPRGRHIVLFTTEPLALREANARLWDEGFRGVLRLDEVRRVERIPVLGTGKTDYKVLRAQIEAETKAKGAVG
jgi:acyl-CoA synthetase (AMP-forming)/AMP-acid ligase II/acyl carrier protein